MGCNTPKFIPVEFGAKAMDYFWIETQQSGHALASVRLSIRKSQMLNDFREAATAIESVVFIFLAKERYRLFFANFELLNMLFSCAIKNTRMVVKQHSNANLTKFGDKLSGEGHVTMTHEEY